MGTAVLVGLLILAHSCICVHTRVHTAVVPSAWGGVRDRFNMPPGAPGEKPGRAVPAPSQPQS